MNQNISSFTGHDNFAFIEYNVYTACLRENEQWDGRGKRAGSMKVEDRLILYLLSYCLIPRSTGNHAQPMELDLKYINRLKLAVLMNWPKVICKRMLEASKSHSQGRLPYPMLVTYLLQNNDIHIPDNDEVKEEFSADDYCLGKYVLHSAKIYEHPTCNIWMWKTDIAEEGNCCKGCGESPVDESHRFSIAAFRVSNQEDLDMRFDALQRSSREDLFHMEQRLIDAFGTFRAPHPPPSDDQWLVVYALFRS
ncbi:hypothetical protein RIF29_25190 [Crotalaria pallida]|uniref:Uncharacterized protein n=1 Tax=Crotalaria pallida TaxID=3830 RepID=A0AAN9ELV1_CROPI